MIEHANGWKLYGFKHSLRYRKGGPPVFCVLATKREAGGVRMWNVEGPTLLGVMEEASSRAMRS